MDKFLLVLFLFSGIQAHPQQEVESKILFSEALFMHLPKYEKKASKLYRLRKYDEAKKLFDSLINHGLAGSYMDNFTFSDLRKRKISLYDFKKPVYLLTYASWCVRGKGEIPALNELSKNIRIK